MPFRRRLTSEKAVKVDPKVLGIEGHAGGQENDEQLHNAENDGRCRVDPGKLFVDVIGLWRQ